MTASDWGPDSPATSRFRAFYDWPAPVEFEATLPDDLDGPEDERQFLLDEAPFAKLAAVRVERADLPPSVAAPGRTPATEGDGTPEPAEGKSAADWRPGDPVHVEKPRRQLCLNASCGTEWVGADVATCPECGSLVGQAAVSAEPPLCALDESNDMEAFAALPECVLCGGTGKQLPDGFWGEEPVSEDDATVRKVAEAVAAVDGWTIAWPAEGQQQERMLVRYLDFARAAVRALREGQ